MLAIHEISTGFKIKNKSTEIHSKISFNLESGSVTLLLGANGIGKSVFLKTLLNIYKPLGGFVTLNGKQLSSMPNDELSSFISLMLPTPPNIELMSALDIAMSGRQRFTKSWQLNNDENEAIVNSYFRICGIEELKDKNFAQLSDGEKQKVMLVRCLSQETPILLLDEPMAFLDYPSRKQFLSLVKKIAEEQGKYIIISTHDIDISLPYANHILAFTKNDYQFFNNPKIFSTDLIFSEKA
jgi:iron complex transport system ATP-binding protein